jgi:hypothetical protein
METEAVVRSDARNGGARAVMGVLACAIVLGMMALPANAQSLSDRFKSLFGGKPDEPAQAAPPPDTGEPKVDEDCPPVSIRAGASTYAVAAPGKQAVGNDVRFQVTITKTARECFKASGEVTAHIGIQGRVISGPAGAPASVEIPIRVAVVQGGVAEKVIATKAYRTQVAMSEEGTVPFSFVAEDLVYPAPAAAVADNYLFYVGFDPQALAPEPRPKPVKRKK